MPGDTASATYGSYNKLTNHQGTFSHILLHWHWNLHPFLQKKQLLQEMALTTFLNSSLQF